jgi:prepilin-type N-terminal cleavage/methylation domain-containing protein
MRAGFSIVELMVVVAILAILTTMGIQQFHFFRVRAMQTEAKMNLQHIMQLQNTYFLENHRLYLIRPGNLGISLTDEDWPTPDTCNNQNELGFRVTCSSARYGYSVASVGGAGVVPLASAQERYNEVRKARSVWSHCSWAESYSRWDSWRAYADDNRIELTNPARQELLKYCP